MCRLICTSAGRNHNLIGNAEHRLKQKSMFFYHYFSCFAVFFLRDQAPEAHGGCDRFVMCMPLYSLALSFFLYILPCIPVCILHKSIAGRYRPVRVADGSITARCRFIKNASWDTLSDILGWCIFKVSSAVNMISV